MLKLQVAHNIYIGKRIAEMLHLNNNLFKIELIYNFLIHQFNDLKTK